MRRFENRVVIVSGATSGIGLAVARRLVGEGASVVIVGAPVDERDLEPALALLRAHGRAIGFVADVAEDGTADRTVAAALSEYGRLDALINNAGTGYFETLLDAPLEHLDRTLAVNVRGTFAMSQVAARVMADSGGGAIVNTASTASFVGEEFQAAYNVSKAAIIGLTRSFAVDLAPVGVRVNAVAPGWVVTRASESMISDAEQWSKHRTRIPLDRGADPDEVAAVHLFLASSDASYVTGAVYLVDGGMTAGNRYSNWAAVEPPQEGLKRGIPDIPVDMHARKG